MIGVVSICWSPLFLSAAINQPPALHSSTTKHRLVKTDWDVSSTIDSAGASVVTCQPKPKSALEAIKSQRTTIEIASAYELHSNIVNQ